MYSPLLTLAMQDFRACLELESVARLLPPPRDFSSLNDVGTNLIMKLDGFPPFVVYLAYVGTPEGVITGTRPDGGYWPQRVREGRNEGWMRIGDDTFAIQATEILGDARLPMLELWSPRAARSARDCRGGGRSRPNKGRAC
jgi:hypothetical protein